MNRILEWTAVALTIAGAICTSFSLIPINIWLFNIASATWVIHSYRVKRRALLVTNIGLLLVYSFGVLRNII